ncbi:hypothetical protein OF83DRAFT_450993 [Amylostereum chailletii]|nr:hypothetical protein OF83DRAFT_450993 [Amylostereum chailletii]
MPLSIEVFPCTQWSFVSLSHTFAHTDRICRIEIPMNCWDLLWTLGMPDLPVLAELSLFIGENWDNDQEPYDAWTEMLFGPEHYDNDTDTDTADDEDISVDDADKDEDEDEDEEDEEKEEMNKQIGVPNLRALHLECVSLSRSITSLLRAPLTVLTANTCKLCARSSFCLRSKSSESRTRSPLSYTSMTSCFPTPMSTPPPMLRRPLTPHASPSTACASSSSTRPCPSWRTSSASSTSRHSPRSSCTAIANRICAYRRYGTCRSGRGQPQRGRTTRCQSSMRPWPSPKLSLLATPAPDLDTANKQNATRSPSELGAQLLAVLLQRQVLSPPCPLRKPGPPHFPYPFASPPLSIAPYSK